MGFFDLIGAVFLVAFIAERRAKTRLRVDVKNEDFEKTGLCTNGWTTTLS
ncbi:Hexuronate transporter [Klebsiella michiganensis]|nr:Hexuronate transporter [Klebsiella michiganensis]